MEHLERSDFMNEQEKFWRFLRHVGYGIIFVILLFITLYVITAFAPFML